MVGSPLSLPQPRKVADAAAVMPQRALQETLPTPASMPAAPSAIDQLMPASLPLRRPACGSKVKKQTLLKIKAGTPGRAQSSKLISYFPLPRALWFPNRHRLRQQASLVGQRRRGDCRGEESTPMPGRPVHCPGQPGGKNLPVDGSSWRLNR